MKSLLLPALALVFVLASCEKAASPTTTEVPVKVPVDDTTLREARDALARQAMEVETRSALLDKQLADLEARLQQSENESLRGQLEGLRQQNDQLRTQADSARRQSDTLTQRLAASAPAAAAPLAAPAAPRDYAVFYERLAPHGRWIDVSGHGLCFQPRLARNRTWRPYVDGCWGWSSLGWTWQTSEPFGWATYHYGRWVNLTSHGWLWVPGCEWAPAWVAWRQSRDHIGWAPLPPESGPCAPVRRDCDTRYNLGPASYTFVRTTHFVRPSYTTCIQPVSYNSTLFHHTVNITQIVPCGGGKPGGIPVYMHHGGPPRHQIEETCRQPVPQTQIHPVEPAQIAIKPSNLGPPRGSPSVIELVQLPPAAQNRLPDVRPVERIENPILANPYAGVPASARPAIQQTLAAEVRQVVLADSPRPMPSNPTPEAPATLPESTPSTPSTPETSSSPTEPQPALTANLSAPIENRGAQPQITPPNLPPVVINQPALLVSTPPTSSERSDRSEMSVPSAPSPIETPQPATTATLPPVETPSATPETATVPVIPPAADEAVRTAAEQQVQMAAAQQQQAEETARRAAEEETARQAQMQAQTQATEAQRQAQEQAQQQAQMEAARVAQEEAQQMRAKETDRRAIEEEAARQAQMQAQSQAAEAQRLAQEQAQQQAAQMEAARVAAEEAQRQAQMEAQRQAQMEAQRQAQEEQRQAQMEAQRQAQMEAQRQAQEEQRQAQMEAQRQAQMEAQRQAEDAARRAAEEAQRQAQMEAQRQAQMEAQRQAEEAARRAAEEAQRQAQMEAQRQAEEAARQAAAAAAAQQPSPPPQ